MSQKSHWDDLPVWTKPTQATLRIQVAETYCCYPVEIIGEQSDTYRVRIKQYVKIPGQPIFFEAGATLLAPKHLVTVNSTDSEDSK